MESIREMKNSLVSIIINELALSISLPVGNENSPCIVWGCLSGETDFF